MYMEQHIDPIRDERLARVSRSDTADVGPERRYVWRRQHPLVHTALSRPGLFIYVYTRSFVVFDVRMYYFINVLYRSKQLMLAWMFRLRSMSTFTT